MTKLRSGDRAIAPFGSIAWPTLAFGRTAMLHGSCVCEDSAEDSVAALVVARGCGFDPTFADFALAAAGLEVLQGLRSLEAGDADCFWRGSGAGAGDVCRRAAGR